MSFSIYKHSKEMAYFSDEFQTMANKHLEIPRGKLETEKLHSLILEHEISIQLTIILNFLRRTDTLVASYL